MMLVTGPFSSTSRLGFFRRPNFCLPVPHPGINTLRSSGPLEGLPVLDERKLPLKDEYLSVLGPGRSIAMHLHRSIHPDQMGRAERTKDAHCTLVDPVGTTLQESLYICRIQ
jgi:hypothetical protein